jgi:hypothetical protein
MLKKLAESRDRSIVFSLSVPRVIRRSMLGMLLALVAVALAHAADRDCIPDASLPPPEIGQPRNIDDLKSQLIYYKCSGAYDRQFSKIIDQAISHVLNRAKDGGHLAIVLDIDETSLSNWEEMKANDFGLIKDGPCNVAKSDVSGSVPNAPCGFGAWVLLAKGKPLDTLRLFKIARANNVAVFFITGRKDDEKHKVQEATVENLRKAGYTDWAGLKFFDDKSTIQEFKTAKRNEIEESGYKIIANVGDQYSDLRGGHAERIFKVPNPFYFVR